MKKFFTILAIALISISLTNCEYDDSELWNEMESVKDRVTTLEDAVQKTNGDITALQAIVTALQSNLYITKVNNTNDGGYTLTFSDGQIVTISNSNNSVNAPVVSVKQDTDDNYYWMVNGEWLLVDGEKVRANGKDGADGTNGTDGKDGINGTDGKDGVDGVSPLIRINEQTKVWEISTDGGQTWTSTGVVAEGKDGQNGTDGKDGVDGTNGKDGVDGTNGKDGVDGKDAIAPQIRINSVTKEWEISTDSGQTWTSTGVVAEGQNGADGADGKDGQNGVDGTNGKDGADGKDGKDAIAPQVRINSQTKEWEISTDGGQSWTSTGVVAEGKDGQNGAAGQNGDSLFKSVDTSNSQYVVITLTNGTIFRLARYDESAPLFIIKQAPSVAQIEYGKSVSYSVEKENVAEYIISKPEGWKVNFSGNQLTITAPAKDKCHYDKEGVVAVTVVSTAGKSAIAKINVMAGEWVEDMEIRTLTFEDKDAKFSPYMLDYADNYAGREIAKWSHLIDTPQYNGPLTYGNDQMDAMYFWYDEGNTELYHMFPDNYAYCFWGGGHAISNYWGAGYTDEDRNAHIAKYYGQDYVNQWAGKPGADAALGWFLLQFMTPVAPHSGENFCVHYGYKDFFSYIENLPEISFNDGVARVIDHMYVTNTNYTLNQLYNGVKSEEGNSFGGNWTGLTEDAWLKIVAQGFSSIDDDEPCAEVEFYLVNGLNVVEDWQKWDLTELGAVEKVRFNFLYSDKMGGRYGFTIPGYFAYDDIAVQFGRNKVFK